MIAALLSAGALLSSACAPISCPPRHEAVRMETMCPPCSPDQPCECESGDFWECRPSPELAEERRRESQRQTEERLSAARAKAAREGLLMSKQRMMEENGRRFFDALAMSDRGEPHPKCGMDGWLILREAGVAPDGDAIVTEEVCEKLPARKPKPAVAVAPPPKVDADRKKPVADAVALCKKASPARCGADTRRGYFACRKADGTVPDYGPQGFSCPNAVLDVDVVCETEWVPALEPCPKAGCFAGKDQCCQPDGKIVRPCGQVDVPRETGCNAGATCRGAGGWCYPCR